MFKSVRGRKSTSLDPWILDRGCTSVSHSSCRTAPFNLLGVMYLWLAVGLDARVFEADKTYNRNLMVAMNLINHTK